MDIKKFLNSDNMISFYDDNDDSFYVGYLIDSDDIFAVFNLVTTRGYEDGIYFTRKDNLSRIDYGDKYTEKIEKLFKIYDQKKYEYKRTKSDLLSNIIEKAESGKKIIKVELTGENSVSGFVINKMNSDIYIQQLDEYGQIDGITAINKDCINRIWYDTGNERTSEILYKNCAKKDDGSET